VISLIVVGAAPHMALIILICERVSKERVEEAVKKPIQEQEKENEGGQQK